MINTPILSHMTWLYTQFVKLARGHLARTTLTVFCWNLARILTQLLWVVLLARALGPEGYGGFSGLAGLAIALSGLSGLGLGLRLYQDAARDSYWFSLRWAQAVKALAWSGPILTLLFIISGQWIFPSAGLPLLAMIGAAEVWLAPTITQVAFAYGARGRMSRATAAPVVLSIARVAAVFLLYCLPIRGGIYTYAALHLAMTALAAGTVAWWCRMELAPTRIKATLTWKDLCEGLGFSTVWASGLLLGSIDKVFVLRTGGAEITGQYTAAQRFASLAALPVDALVTAVMPRLFRAGSEQSSPLRMISWLAFATGAYGAFAGAVLWSGAWLLPWLLGKEFEGAVTALQVLAFWVPAYCLRILGSNVLLGFGLKRWRFISELSAVGTTIILILAWVPSHGIQGAAYSFLGAELLLALVVWVRIIAGRRIYQETPE